MNDTYFEDVADFHHKFGQPFTKINRRCDFPPPEEIMYRLRFIDEEVIELKEAIELKDLPKTLDALVDLVYVVLGTAHYFGAPFDEAWVEVHAANMKKVRAEPSDTQHKRGPCEPMRKPPGWVPPDIETVIAVHNNRVLLTGVGASQ